MFTYSGRSNTLRMTFNRSGNTSFSIKALTEGAEPCKPVTLGTDELRALRDRINLRLGETALIPNTGASPMSTPPTPDRLASALATVQGHRDAFDAARGQLDDAISSLDDLRGHYDDAVEHLDEALDALST